MPKKNRGRTTKKRQQRKMKGGMFEWFFGKSTPQESQQMTGVVPGETASSATPTSSGSELTWYERIVGKSTPAAPNGTPTGTPTDTSMGSTSDRQESEDGPRQGEQTGGKRRRHKKTKRRHRRSKKHA